MREINLLSKCWKWIGKTPEEYSKDGLQYIHGHMEFDYPEFDAIKNRAMRIVDSGTMLNEHINVFLTIMALDNESEQILDYATENCSEEQVRVIVDIGIDHLQPNARWQLAELIYSRRPENFIQSLEKLSKDRHPYVRRRANSCIERLKIENL